MTRTTTTLLLATALGLTACTSTSHDDAKPTPAPSSASPSPAGPLTLGQPNRWHEPGYAGTTTALAYHQPVTVKSISLKALGYPASSVWATLDVKVCNAKGSKMFTVSQSPWALAFADDTRTAAPSISGSDIPKPEFPVNDTRVMPGDCIRGLVTFVVGKGQRPVRVVYGTETQDPVVWAVPAK
jgi:hypothetical protein